MLIDRRINACQQPAQHVNMVHPCECLQILSLSFHGGASVGCAVKATNKVAVKGGKAAQRRGARRRAWRWSSDGRQTDQCSLIRVRCALHRVNAMLLS